MFRCLILSCVFIITSSSVSAQSTYVGPPGGLWSEPTNWSPIGVPANDGVNFYNVILPAGTRVTFDLPTPTQISGASFEADSRIDLGDTSLEVLGVALLEDTFIDASGPLAAFLTKTEPPSVSGSKQRMQVGGGALVSLGLSSYVWTYPVL